MNNKIIDLGLEKEYKRRITHKIFIDMVDEILGALDMVHKDANKENVKLLYAHRNLFNSTVEEELTDIDKVTVYSYAQKVCVQILMERRHSKPVLKAIHRFCSKMEIRKRELEQKGYYAMVLAHQKSIKFIKEMIQMEMDKPDKALEDRLYMVLQELEKLDIY